MSHNDSTPHMISLQVTDKLLSGGTVTATVHGLASERDDLIYEATDAVLMTRVRMNRITAPLGAPTPMVPTTNASAEFACRNLDGEAIA